MIFLFYCSAISYQRIYHEKKVDRYYIPQWDFGFQKGGKYTFIFSNLRKDVLIYIAKEDKINEFKDIIKSTGIDTINNSICKLNQTFKLNNFIVIKACNGLGHVSGFIENQGILGTLIASCDASVFDFTLDISYSNPTSKLGYNVQPCIKTFPIFIIIYSVLFVFMVILWICNISYINIFTILIPIYLMIIIIDKYLLYKILYIHDRFDITTNYSKSYENIVITKIFLVYCIVILSMTIIVSYPNIKLIYILLTIFFSFIIAYGFYILFIKEGDSIFNIFFSSVTNILQIPIIPGFFLIFFKNVLHGLLVFLISANFIMNMIVETFFEVSEFTNLYKLFIIFNSIEIFIFIIIMIIFYYNKRFWQKYYTLRVTSQNLDDNTIVLDSDIESIKSDQFKSNVKKILFKKDSQLKTIGKNSFAKTKIKSIAIPSSVINIESNAFAFCPTLKKVNFMEPSKIREFKPFSFEYSEIEYLYIPSSIVKLKKFWCCNTQNLINVEISYNNPYYKCYDNSFIVGKSKSDDVIYENLIFASRNIRTITIPSFIKQISECAFEYCQKITEINFSENSNLRIICKYSFAFSSIVKIKIPSSVVLIDDYSFSECKKLKDVIINNDSKLKIIGRNAFYNNSSLRSFMVPSSVIRIDDSAFSKCNKLELFEIKDNSELITFDKEMFDDLSHIVIFAPTGIIDDNNL